MHLWLEVGNVRLVIKIKIMHQNNANTMKKSASFYSLFLFYSLLRHFIFLITHLCRLIMFHFILFSPAPAPATKTSVLNRLELGLLADADDMMLQAEVQDLIEDNRAHIIPFSLLKVDANAILGQGAFSKVFRARYRGRDVATKFFTRFMDLTPEMIRAFSMETVMHVALKHRNVVRCYGLCVIPPAVAIVT